MNQKVIWNLIGVFFVISTLFFVVGLKENKKSKEYQLLKSDLKSLEIEVNIRCDLYSEYRYTRYECYLEDEEGKAFLSMMSWSSIIHMKKKESNKALPKLSFYEFEKYRIKFDIINSLKCVLNPFGDKGEYLIKNRSFSSHYHCLKNSEELIKIIQRNKV